MKGDNEFVLATPTFPHCFSQALQVLLVPLPALNVRGRLFPPPVPAVLQQSYFFEDAHSYHVVSKHQRSRYLSFPFLNYWVNKEWVCKELQWSSQGYRLVCCIQNSLLSCSLCILKIHEQVVLTQGIFSIPGLALLSQKIWSSIQNMIFTRQQKVHFSLPTCTWNAVLEWWNWFLQSA